MMTSKKHLKDTSENKRAFEDEISPSASKCVTNAIKQKKNLDLQNCKEIRRKIMEAMESQVETRKQGIEALLRSLSEVIEEIKEDNTVLKSNQEKLQKLAATLNKCISQATAAQDEKITTLNKIHTAFKKQCEREESEQKSQAKKLADELEKDIKNLHQKLVTETRRSSLENLRKTFFQSMQNDF